MPKSFAACLILILATAAPAGAQMGDNAHLPFGQLPAGVRGDNYCSVLERRTGFGGVLVFYQYLIWDKKAKKFVAKMAENQKLFLTAAGINECPKKN